MRSVKFCDNFEIYFKLYGDTVFHIKIKSCNLIGCKQIDKTTIPFYKLLCVAIKSWQLKTKMERRRKRVRNGFWGEGKVFLIRMYIRGTVY